jgi:hypothetical protein
MHFMNQKIYINTSYIERDMSNLNEWVRHHLPF